jgi:hypothetical protein
MKTHCLEKCLLGYCNFAAMISDETGNRKYLLLWKLRQFALPPSPLRQDESTSILAAGT